jgi:hypothetical protein
MNNYFERRKRRYKIKCSRKIRLQIPGNEKKLEVYKDNGAEGKI